MRRGVLSRETCSRRLNPSALSETGRGTQRSRRPCCCASEPKETERRRKFEGGRAAFPPLLPDRRTRPRGASRVGVSDVPTTRTRRRNPEDRARVRRRRAGAKTTLLGRSRLVRPSGRTNQKITHAARVRQQLPGPTMPWLALGAHDPADFNPLPNLARGLKPMRREHPSIYLYLYPLAGAFFPTTACWWASSTRRITSA